MIVTPPGYTLQPISDTLPLTPSRPSVSQTEPEVPGGKASRCQPVCELCASASDEGLLCRIVFSVSPQCLQTLVVSYAMPFFWAIDSWELDVEPSSHNSTALLFHSPQSCCVRASSAEQCLQRRCWAHESWAPYTHSLQSCPMPRVAPHPRL